MGQLRGVVPDGVIDGLAQGVPERVDTWLGGQVRGYLVGRGVDVVGAMGVGAGNAALSQGLYGRIWGPDKKFEVTGWMVGAGAGVAGLMHGVSKPPPIELSGVVDSIALNGIDPATRMPSSFAAVATGICTPPNANPTISRAPLRPASRRGLRPHA